jgi:hypothetical protein
MPAEPKRKKRKTDETTTPAPTASFLDTVLKLDQDTALFMSSIQTEIILIRDSRE